MILFIYASFSTFVKNDYEILSKYSNVEKHQYTQGKNLAVHFISQLKLLKWLLKNISTADKIFCWFADYHSFLPAFLSKLFKKEFYVVLGGYDVIHLTEIGYGSLKNPLRKFCAMYTIKHASLNLAVSNFVHQEAKKLVPAAQIKTVYNGVDISKFQQGTFLKENLILTVGAGSTWQRIRLKGIDFFCDVARRLPEYSFLVIGIDPSTAQFIKDIPSNVHIIGKMEHHQVISYYQKAKVYCQFSVIESFGLAAAEAMLCGCVPVVTDVGALQEIIGDTGFILSHRSVELAAELIDKAMYVSIEQAQRSRERITAHFSLQQRANELVSIL